MKKITIEVLTLRNFKGIENASFNFKNGQNFIHGANRTGKTTLFDSFNWLLFGKNSANESDFEIKTIRNNKVIHNLEHEVSGVINFDNRRVELKKVLTEKWTKKRGSATSEMTGHETNHFIDGVPKSQSEYKAFIDMIIQESISRTITDPNYFNIVMPWKNRRELLFQLVGIGEDVEIAENSNEEIRSTVLSILNQGKSIEDEKKRIAVEKKRLNEKIDEIPSRIDEVNRSKQELPEFTKEDLEKQKSIFKSDESRLLQQLEDENKKFEEINNERIQKQNEVFELETKLNDKTNDYKRADKTAKDALADQIDKVKRELKELNTLFEDSESQIRLKEHELKLKKETKDKMLSLYNEEKERVFIFDETACKCPTCSTPFAPEEVSQKKERANKTFNETKQSSLERIKSEGQKITLEIEEIETLLKALKISIDDFETKKNELKKLEFDLQESIDNFKILDLENVPELIEIKKQIEAAKLETAKIQIQDNSQIKEQLQTIKEKFEKINSDLSIYENVGKSNARIDELKSELKTLNQAKADLEQIEFKIESFVQFKIKNIEEKINNSFKIVNFKMFNKLMNGGFEETCVCTVDGVSFKNLNNELKLNAGLDIIQTLQNFFNISAPIFIDNRESVSEIYVSDEVQIINLIVDANCKQLTQK